MINSSSNFDSKSSSTTSNMESNNNNNSSSSSNNNNSSNKSKRIESEFRALHRLVSHHKLKVNKKTNKNKNKKLDVDSATLLLESAAELIQKLEHKLSAVNPGGDFRKQFLMSKYY